MRTTPPPLWWASPVAAGAGLAIATIAALSGLRTVLSPGDWSGVGMLLVLVLATATTTVRLMMVHRRLTRGTALVPPASLLPSGVGLVIAAWIVTGTYGTPGTGFTPFFGWDAFARIGDRFTTAADLVWTGIAPMAPSTPLTMLVVTGTAFVFLVADSIAIGLGYPSLAGVAVLWLWVPPLTTVHDVPTDAFVLTIVGLAVVLAVDEPRTGVPRRRTTSRRERRARLSSRMGAASAAIAVVLVGALTAGALGSALPSPLHEEGAPGDDDGGPVTLASTLDLRDNLAERSGRAVLRYTSDRAVTEPLRAFTLTDFNGRRWQRGESQDSEIVTDPDQLLWPSPAGAGTTASQTLEVTLDSYRGMTLPIPVDPRSIETSRPLAYDPVLDEVGEERPTTSGDSYTTTTFERSLSPESLRAASGADPGDSAYLDVPASQHADEVRSLAQQIVGGAPTRYDQALALQDFFRDSTEFTYDPTVAPPQTDDAVWDFLQQGNGYCVQYATTMAIMARTLGIPTRLGVGFLPGKRIGDGEYEITGKDSHAWPELHFPGLGWVRFEPTPAQQTGGAPAWTRPSPDQSATSPSPAPSSTATTAPTPSTSASTAPPTTGAASDRSSSAVSWTWVLAALAATVGAGWVVRRRSRSSTTVRDAEDAWRRLHRSLDGLGVGWPDSATPRQAPVIVADRVRERWGVDLPDDGSFTALVSAVEDSRYSPRPTTVDPRTLRQRVDRVIAMVSAARKERVSGPRVPDDGPSAPPSA